jgi:methionine sulfoxide reductase catalytic subunit
MARRRPDWELPERDLTDESVYVSRRRFIKAVGLGGLAAGGLALGGRSLQEAAWAQDMPVLPKLTATLNTAYADAGRPVSKERLVSRYNNFYEFTTKKENVWKLAKNFRLDPYELKVEGLVERPGSLSIEQIEKLGIEERIYRFRCVEAWAMTVPWIGVPLRKLLEHVGVKKEAKYVSFISFLDKKQAPGQRKNDYTWPYFEALRLDEALNDLTMVVTGIYGKRLPPQSGAPLRIVTPWKYGYKSPKSVVLMKLTKERPPTFWNQAVQKEYSWLSNVEPEIAHPRWSQKTERILGSNTRRPSVRFNGYGDQVASLYTP